MSDFFFVLKCLAATVVLLICMQMRVGGRTVEQHSLHWIQTSNAVEELRGVAEGAVRASRTGYRKASDYFGQNSVEVGESDSWFKIKRSEAYYRQKEREEREARRAAASTSASEN
jgi:hypothetical protein